MSIKFSLCQVWNSKNRTHHIYNLVNKIHIHIQRVLNLQYKQTTPKQTCSITG